MSSDESLGQRYRQAAASQTPDSHPDDVLWEQVMCGEASLAEQERVREHVVRCAECGAIYRALLDVRREAPAFDPGVPAATPARASNWVAYAVAASVVALVGTAALLLSRTAPIPADSSTPRTADPPATSAAPPLTSLPVFALVKAPVMLSASAALTPRGVADDRKAFVDALGAALVPYRADDFLEAAARLTRLGGTYPDRVEPALYAGVALLLSGRPAEAVTELERARTVAPPELADEVLWRLALAHVHAGSPERASDPLARVCAGASPYRDMSCQAAAALAARK